MDARENYSGFLPRLQAAGARVLLLDYDGTLAPFHADRMQAFPYPQVPPLLAQIRQQGTRVIFITGRPAGELAKLSGIHPPPEIWGSHGLERLYPDGRHEVMALDEPTQAALHLARDLVARDLPQARVEVKPGGVAVHWRGAGPSEVAQLQENILQLWRPLTESQALRILEFDGGLELRAAVWNKGHAVKAILQEAGEPAAIAYLGDDQTDEDAFCALKGKGLTVLVRTESRPTTADVWLQPPQQLVRFLQDWLRASGGEA
jgi:trehalose-phosphatase